MTRSSRAPSADAQPDGDWVVRCEDLGKRFKIYSNPWHRVAEWCTLNRAHLHRDFWAVRGVTFELRRGECLGVVGRNGSGKSTLLKMVTGVAIPSEGTSALRGRVLSLIELGAGLNKDLTGRQNVHNMAQLLNFPPGFAREKMEEIERFADIGAFFDRAVRSYSSGMTVRVTFSMFAAFEPEVLIVDEALSVGDIFFVQKCTRRIHELLENGTTMLLVSHDAGAITNLCDRAILLDRGTVAFQGEPVDAIARYHAALRTGASGLADKWQRDDAPGPSPSDEPSDAADASPPTGGANESTRLVRRIMDGNVLTARPPDPSRRHGAGALRIMACRIADADDDEATTFGIGQAVRIGVLLRADGPVAQPRAGIRLINRFGVQVFCQGTPQLDTEVPALEAGQGLVLTFVVTLDLSPGEYTISLDASEPDHQGDPNVGVFHDQIDGLGPIRVNHPPLEALPFFGVARLPMAIEAALVERQPVLAARP